MAIFSKKEPEGKTPSVQSPQPEKQNASNEQKKVIPKPISSTKPSDASKETTYLGKNLKITGNVSGAGNLIILGTFDGEFNLKGQLKVAQGALVKGNIMADGVSINGQVDGSIVAKERILLDTTASMKGRLTTPKISIQDGAIFDGELQMSGKMEPVQKPAPEATNPQVKQPPKAQAQAQAQAVSEIK